MAMGLMRIRAALPFVVLTLLIIIIPWILTGPYFSSLMVMIGIYAMLAIGMCLLIGYLGQFSLAHPAFFGIGAYFSALLTVKQAWPPLAALILGAVVVGLIAYGMGRVLFRLRGFYLSATTLGFLVIAQTCMTELQNITAGARGVPGIPHFAIGSFAFDGYLSNYFLIWFAVLFTLVLSSNLVKSKIGTATLAVSSSVSGAATSGIDVAKIKVQIFTFASVVAGVAGSLFAHYYTFIGPDTFGLKLLIELLVIPAIGGFSSIWGGLIGAIIFVGAGELLKTFFVGLAYSGEVIMVVWGVVLILTLIFARGGIVLTAERIYGRLKTIHIKVAEAS